MSNRLGGKQGTAYTGTNANQPPNWTFNDRPPTQYDTQNVSEGDFWLDGSATGIERFWVLVSLAGDSMSRGALAQWVQVGAGNLETLTGNSGGAVFPDGSDNINVVGDGTTIDIVGNPGTNTLTASTVGTGVVSSLTGDSGGPVFPIAGNTNIFGTSGVVTVTGNPGTHTLTINAGDTIATSYITSPATGVAVPAAGVLTFAGTGNTTVSAAGSTVTINSTGGSGTVTGLLADDGHTVTPTAGVIQVAGGSNITTTGTIGPNTLTIHYSPTTSFTATFNTETNITGDGTIAQLGATAAATVLTNVGGNFFPGNGAGSGATFTVPVTGLYYICMYANFTVSASMTAGIDFSIGTSGSFGYNVSIGPTKNSVPGYNNFAGDINVGGGFIAQLTSGWVLTFTAQSNGTSKVTTVTFGTVGGYLIN